MRLHVADADGAWHEVLGVTDLRASFAPEGHEERPMLTSPRHARVQPGLWRWRR